MLNLGGFLILRNIILAAAVLLVGIILITASFALVAFFTSPMGHVVAIIGTIIAFFWIVNRGGFVV